MATPDKIPYVHNRPVVGNGVSAQRRQFPINGKKTRGKDIPLAQYEGSMPSMDQIPFMRAKDTGGQGVGAQRKVLGTGLAAPFPY